MKFADLADQEIHTYERAPNQWLKNIQVNGGSSAILTKSGHVSKILAVKNKIRQSSTFVPLFGPNANPKNFESKRGCSA